MERGCGKRLQEHFGVSQVMVSLSLNYSKNSFLARRIRYVALKEYGGVQIGE